MIKDLNIRRACDGIDLASCRNVRSAGCDIDTGDDAISLQSGRRLNDARLGKPCKEIVIAHCTLGGLHWACSGIGSETSGGIRNVRIDHTKFAHSHTHAIYIKTRTGRAGAIENITGDDLDVADGGFLRINLTTAGNASTVDDSVEGKLGLPLGRNFRFSNVRATNVTTLVEAVRIAPEKPLQGPSLVNITGTCAKAISLANITRAALRDIRVTGYAGPFLTQTNVQGAGLDAPK